MLNLQRYFYAFALVQAVRHLYGCIRQTISTASKLASMLNFATIGSKAEVQRN